jgi:hypothetical protein
VQNVDVRSSGHLNNVGLGSAWHFACNAILSKIDEKEVACEARGIVRV